MHKLGILSIVFTFNLMNAYGQQLHNLADPNEQIIVTKEFDENGNLIGYDSTYIHSWSNDSNFHFSFNEDLIFGEQFPDINDLLGDFLGDSTFFDSPFPSNNGFPFFDDDDFFKSLNPGFSDSTWMKNFNIDSIQKYHHEFVLPDLQELQKQFQEQLKYFNYTDQFIPDSLNSDQKKELKELQKRHQKELDELRKKWQ